MRFSTRIVLLVLLGFVATLAVGGIAVVSMSRMSQEIGRLAARDFPLIGSLTRISVNHLQSVAALERALLAASSVEFATSDDGEAFDRASATYSDLAATTQDALRATVLRVTAALRGDADPGRREILRRVLNLLHDVGLTQNLHAGAAQRTLFLLEAGRTADASARFAELDQLQTKLSMQIGTLIARIEDLARVSTEAAQDRQQTYLWLMVAAAGSGLAICLILGWVIGRGVTAPIQAVTATLAELVRGNTETRLDIPGAPGDTAAVAVALRTFRDEIIHRRRMVAALAESERRFHALAEVAPVGVFYTDPQGSTQYVNEMGCEVVGLSPAECLGRGWTRSIHPDDRDELLAGWQNSIATQQPHRSEFRLVKPDGTTTWVIGQVTPNRNADGLVSGFVGTITDITEQKQAEAHLLEHANSRTRLHEIAIDSSLSLDEKLNELLVLGTETFHLPLGIISRVENTTYTVLHVHGPEWAPPAGEAFDVGETYCLQTIRANGPVGFHHAGESGIAQHPCYRKFGLESFIGSPLIVGGHRFGTLNFSGREPRAKPFDDSDFSLIQLFAQWIGNEISRQRAEDALRESEERMRLIVENVVDGIITIDERGIIETVNPAIGRIFGYRPGELAGRNVSTLMPSPHREKHDSYLARYRETGEARIIGHGRELEGQRRDGSLFPLDLAVSEMILGDGRLFIGIVRDITERKQVERMKTEFVSSVSHELRTPLTSIRGALGLIVGNLGETLDGRVRELVDIAFNNSQRLINLVNDILDLEKIGSGGMEFRFATTDCVALIRRTLDDNRGLADEYGVTFDLVKAPDRGWVRADDDRIGQVMANLLSNAAKFSPAGQTVEVSITRRGRMVRVAIADHGPGIPEEFRSRIFERFSQADSSDTRRVGGTGLGLSIVKAIVDQHGGRIGFDSEVGVGSTFYFELPVVPAPSKDLTAPPPAERAEPPNGLGGARILVCEDDPDIAKLLAVLLEQSGLWVDVAHDAAAAKALLRRNRYDAMTVDILLPGQDGLSLIREIRREETTRGLPIIVISARAEVARAELEGTAIDILDWLNKPIDEVHLRRALALAIRRQPAGRARLLYVEDDPDLVEVVAALAAETAETTIARNLAEARALLAVQDFDLVILDVRLPDGSGLDLLDDLRTADGQPRPVILFSGDEVDEEMARRVDAALVKSRTTDLQLLTTIRRLIAAVEPVGESERKSP